jgi:hypothetical protein
MASVTKFHVFTSGNLQFNCDTIEDAKEKAQGLIRNKNLEVIIYEAILKITPKPIEVNEIDLRTEVVPPKV